MILTFYYMAATCMQWYRLGRMKKRLSHYLAICNVPVGDSSTDDSKPSCSSTDIVSLAPTFTRGIILYRGIYDNTLAENQKLGDLLCYEGDSRCCTVIPEKRVDLSLWIGFSKGYSTFPFEIIEDDFPTDSIKNINLLLHASLEPATNIDEIHSIRIERFGIPIAWKVDTAMFLIIRTDMQLFTSLSAAFMKKNLAINNHLQLLRIETVSLSGKVYECRPKDLSLGADWIRNLIPRQWGSHILQLKNLCSHVKHRHRDDLLKHHHKKMLPSTKKSSSDKIEKPQKTSKRESVKSQYATTAMNKELDLDPIPTPSINIQPNTSSAEEMQITMEKIGSYQPNNFDEKAQSSVEIKSNENDAKSKFKKQKSLDLILDDKKPSTTSSSKTGLSKFIRTRKHSDKDSESTSKDKKEKGKLAKQQSKDKKKDEPIMQEVMNIIENPLNLLTKSDHYKTKSNDALESKKETILNGSVSKSETTLTPQMNTTGVKSEKMSSGVKVASTTNIKPPNVLIYADSAVERESVTNLLKAVLHKEKYTIYSLSPSSVWWGSKATLLVVCGAVADHLGSKMLTYLFTGGRILCLCSDFINTVLPTFTTAEVRERELVRFSYDRWHRVRMIHHIFCYQPSPGRKLFSKDSSEEVSPNSSRCPTSSIIEVKDPSSNVAHKLEVKVLGAEDTWHTPSLISATDSKSGGIAIFSQVHLEVEPSQYETDENIFPALAESNTARLDIIRHILETHLNVECTPAENVASPPVYKPAYFLGSHELKLAMLARLASGIKDNIYDTAKIKLQFCGKGVEPNVASSSFLPILVHSCPEKFSTLKYFESLKTNQFGRLVIYCDVIDSTMNILDGGNFEHGMAVVAQRQLSGQGRSGNKWLSPEGCAMFSLQLHIPVACSLGKRLPFVQILTSVVVVNAIRTIPGYECLDIGLKWPNDIYANKTVKIGGMLVNSIGSSSIAVCNIGVAINLSNTYPTTCINNLIKEYNQQNGGKLPELKLEYLLASIFNEYERLYELALTDNGISYLYELYYRYWLHENAEVTITSESEDPKQATVMGIDDYGFLKVKSNGRTLSVHPGENSFDMLVGLIAPKIK